MARRQFLLKFNKRIRAALAMNGTAREDQREVNNLPKMRDDQDREQGRMLVIDEAKAARQLLAAATIEDAVKLHRIREKLLDIQDFVFRHRVTRPDSEVAVTGREIEDLKWAVQRALELT